MKQKWKRIVSRLLVFVMVLSLAYVDMGTVNVSAAEMSQKPSNIKTVTKPKKIDNLVYNGNAQALITGGKADSNYDIYYKIIGFSVNGFVKAGNYYDSTATSYSKSLPTATEAGYYTVAYYSYVTSYYTPSWYDGVVEVQIAQRPVTATLSGSATKTYDSTTDVADTGLSITLSALEGNPNSGVVNSEIEAKATFAYDNANVGTDKTVTASGISLVTAGTDTVNTNYKLVQSDGETELTSLTSNAGTITALNISDAAITLDQDSYTYDTTEHTPSVRSVTVSGLTLAESDYDVSVTGQTDANAQDTTYELTVTATGSNYTGSAKKTWRIEKSEQSEEAMAISGQKDTVSYGDSFDLSLAGASGTGAVSWSIGGGDSDYISITQNDNGTCTVTANKVTEAEKTVSVTATKAGDGNYNGGSTKYTFSIGAKDFSNTAVISLPLGFDNTYNGQSQAVTVTDGGRTLTNGTDYEISIELDGNDAEAVQNAGSYTITIKGMGNYTGTVSTPFSIARADQNSMAITGAPATVTYGDSSFTLGVSGVSASDTAVTWESSNTSVATIDASTGAVTIVGAGSANITATNEGDGNYNSKSVTMELTVNKATLTVTPTSGLTKGFSETDPTLTYTVSGLVNNDTENVLSGALSRASGESAGSYEITLGTLAAANYDISLTAGVMFTINANSDALLTVETTENGNKVVSKYNDSGVLVEREVTDKDNNVTTETYNSKTGKIEELTTVNAAQETTEHRKYNEDGSYVKDNFVPEIIGTDNTQYDGSGEVMVRSNDEFVNFLAVYINGKEVSSDNYDKESGSIIIKLKESYLATLKPGTYSISIASTNGDAKTSFVIPGATKTVQNTSNPAAASEEVAEAEEVAVPVETADENQADGTSVSETVIASNKTGTKKPAEEPVEDEPAEDVQAEQVADASATAGADNEVADASAAEEVSNEVAGALITEEKGSSFGWIWLLILLLIVAAVVVGVYYKKNQDKKNS